MKRVLILDDEKPTANALARILRPFYKVDVFQTGHAALEAILATEYDVIVSDVQMPHMSGPEFYTQVCRIKPMLAQHFMYHTGTPVFDGLPTVLKGSSPKVLQDMVKSLSSV
jgi:CheY-like chemotaxis protein